MSNIICRTESDSLNTQQWYKRNKAEEDMATKAVILVGGPGKVILNVSLGILLWMWGTQSVWLSKSHFGWSIFKLFDERSLVDSLKLKIFNVLKDLFIVITCELAFSKLCYALMIRLLSHAAILYFFSILIAYFLSPLLPVTWIRPWSDELSETKYFLGNTVPTIEFGHSKTTLSHCWFSVGPTSHWSMLPCRRASRNSSYWIFSTNWTAQ